MEALQRRSTPIEPLSESAPQTSISYFNGIRSRLASIPTPPSSELPSLSSREDHELSLSTSSTASTATEPLQETSTAATSVITLPEVFMFQKFHVCPSMQVNERIQSLWTERIRKRLSALLLHHIPSGTCLQEFMMVGKKPSTLKPTLIITCGDVQTKKRVERLFRSQGWLQELLRANGIMFVALVAKTSLSAGELTNTTSLDECNSVLLDCGRPVLTPCGISLLVSVSETHPQRHCTLGGLLMVNGEIFGLTAGHPFKGQAEREIAHNEYHNPREDITSLEEDESSDDSNEPFVFNDEDDSSQESISTESSLSIHDLTKLSLASVEYRTHRQHENSETLSEAQDWSYRCSAIFPISNLENNLPFERLRDCDWALLKRLPRSITALPNKIARAYSHSDFVVDKVASDSAYGEVTVTVAGMGAQLGHLHSCPATMNINKSVLDMRLITLERGLPLGSSGAWVILGEELCGIVVAIREDVPWAYMVPIKLILDDIKQKFKTTDVRLPKRDEIEALAASSNAPEDLRLADNDVPEPSLERKGQIGEPAALPNDSLSESSALKSEKQVLVLPSMERQLQSEQEGEVLNEKSSMVENSPEVSIATHAAPHPELPSNINEMDEPMTLNLGQIHVPVTSNERQDHTSQLSNTIPYVPHPSWVAPQRQPRLDGNPSMLQRPTVLLYMLLSLLVKAYEWPYLVWRILRRVFHKLWRNFEIWVLRDEYTRRQRGRMRERIPKFKFTVFLKPSYPDVNDFRYRSPLIFDLLALWYYVRLPFYALANILLNILYCVACFPGFLWVVNRHRNVLADADTLHRQHQESMQMLGDLPYAYGDQRLMRYESTLRGEASSYAAAH